MFGVYFSSQQRNIVCECKLHGKPIIKKKTFSLVSDDDVKKAVF